MRNIAKKCGHIFEPKLLLILILLIIFIILLQNYLKLEPSLEEGFSSKRNLRKLKEKFKKINKEKFGDTKPKEPEHADNLLDVISNMGLYKRKKPKKKRKVRKISFIPYTERFRRFTDSFNEGILGEQSDGIEKSLKKFEKLKGKLWDIFNHASLLQLPKEDD